MAQLVERIGGIRDQFAQEDFGMRIERVNDQVQQLIDFSLKFTLRHRFSNQYRGTPVHYGCSQLRELCQNWKCMPNCIWRMGT